MLLDLGVHEMILLSDTDRSIVGLEGYGLSIAGQRPVSAHKRAAGEKKTKETAS
ncbi:MAG TPA: hypothetical protein VF449_09950 [Parvibaculum sp.]